MKTVKFTAYLFLILAAGVMSLQNAHAFDLRVDRVIDSRLEGIDGFPIGEFVNQFGIPAQIQGICGELRESFPTENTSQGCTQLHNQCRADIAAEVANQALEELTSCMRETEVVPSCLDVDPGLRRFCDRVPANTLEECEARSRDPRILNTAKLNFQERLAGACIALPPPNQGQEPNDPVVEEETPLEQESPIPPVQDQVPLDDELGNGLKGGKIIAPENGATGGCSLGFAGQGANLLHGLWLVLPLLGLRQRRK